MAACHAENNIAIIGPEESAMGRTIHWIELLPFIDGEYPHIKARLYKGAMPDVVNIPFGQGHASGGRWSKGLGQNPYRLIGDDLDPITGYPTHGTTRVKIYKA